MDSGCQPKKCFSHENVKAIPQLSKTPNGVLLFIVLQGYFSKSIINSIKLMARVQLYCSFSNNLPEKHLWIILETSVW